jgi:hypothetical protein
MPVLKASLSVQRLSPGRTRKTKVHRKSLARDKGTRVSRQKQRHTERRPDLELHILPPHFSRKLCARLLEFGCLCVHSGDGRVAR